MPLHGSWIQILHTNVLQLVRVVCHAVRAIAPPNVLLESHLYIYKRLMCVCVFAIHAKTAGPIATKRGGKLEEHLGRNLRLLPSECEARAPPNLVGS